MRICSLRSASVVGAALAACAVVALLPPKAAVGSGAPRAPTTQGAGRLMLPPVGFEATVCEVRLADVTAALEKLSVAALRPQAASAGQFARALGEVGTARVMYHFEQALDLNDPDRITASSSVPIVVQAGPPGAKNTTTMRQDVGVSITCRAYAPREDEPEAAPRLSLHVELSNVVPGRLRSDEEPGAPTFGRLIQTHSGELKLGDPIVLVTLDAGGESPVAYVSLLRFTGSK